MPAYKGRFVPRTPEKYKGNPTNIVYRSSWELKFMGYLDKNPNVLQWASEEIAIPYKSPIDQRVHRYFPDFIVKLKQKNGKETILILEVKPESQTKQPVRKRKTQRFIQESVTYAVNQEKWRAADLFCKEHGWQFKVLTEKDLGI